MYPILFEYRARSNLIGQFRGKCDSNAGSGFLRSGGKGSEGRYRQLISLDKAVSYALGGSAFSRLLLAVYLSLDHPSATEHHSSMRAKADKINIVPTGALSNSAGLQGH